ncbi:MAG: DUF368 domain-containing protein [Eubacteriales bacterium]|nr:DUF368 domain-containing protein [Eubacteriales bacterium]
MKFIMDILRGMVIGLANIIPGVSGGTMMVSMGIYDTIIYCITHVFKQLVKSIKILLPYLIGMLLGIGGGALVLSYLFKAYNLPTNTAFIGLILGGIPAIAKHMDKKKLNKFTIGIGILFFALIIAMQALKVQGGASRVLTPNVFTMILMVFVGAIASSTMIIPGVSGSMVMVLLGFYDSLLGSVSKFINALKSFDFAMLVQEGLILLPFAIGVILGIFFVSKLIEYLLKNHFTATYCGILGLVLASPIVVLLNANFASVTLWQGIVSPITLAIGYFIAKKLADEDSHTGGEAA